MAGAGGGRGERISGLAVCDDYPTCDGRDLHALGQPNLAARDLGGAFDSPRRRAGDGVVAPWSRVMAVLCWNAGRRAGRRTQDRLVVRPRDRHRSLGVRDRRRWCGSAKPWAGGWSSKASHPRPGCRFAAQAVPGMATASASRGRLGSRGRRSAAQGSAAPARRRLDNASRTLTPPICTRRFCQLFGYRADVTAMLHREAQRKGNPCRHGC